MFVYNLFVIVSTHTQSVSQLTLTYLNAQDMPDTILGLCRVWEEDDYLSGLPDRTCYSCAAFVFVFISLCVLAGRLTSFWKDVIIIITGNVVDYQLVFISWHHKRSYVQRICICSYTLMFFIDLYCA